MFLCIDMCTCIWVPVEASGIGCPWSWRTGGCEMLDVGVRNQIWAIWKSSRHSKLLRHLCSLYLEHEIISTLDRLCGEYSFVTTHW